MKAFRRHRTAEVPVTAVLLAILLAVNGVAIAGLVAARRDARNDAAFALELQTTRDARAVETTLSDLRGDLVFLARAPALANALERMEASDPQVRRWSRLDAETTLLLFLEGRPALAEVTVVAEGGIRVRVGRAAGAPVVLPADAFDPGDSRPRWRGPIAEPAPAGAALVATLEPHQLVTVAVPGGGERLELLLQPEGSPPAPTPLLAEAVIRAGDWRPPIDWRLRRRETSSAWIESVELLAGRFQWAVGLNLATMLLTVGLGWLALRQVRRASLMAVESEQQARLRELERRLAHSERLAGLGRLAAGLAHEINNPLEGMANYLSLLESDLARDDATAARALLPRLREGLERTAGVLRRVLVFSQPQPSEPETLDLRTVLEEALAFARGLDAFQRLELTFSLPQEALAVRGASGPLGQLFLNLLLNAAQVQPDGGKVEIHARSEDERAVVVVADRGPGLTPEAERRLFEPFFSTRGSTGLGLAVCHGIARDHGGTISAGNREGGGARFEVKLPLATVTTDLTGEWLATGGGETP